MFKYISIILLFVFSAQTPALAADKNPNKLAVAPELLAQIPNNWHLKDLAKGDLNQDGIDDYVAVVEADFVRENFVRRFYYFSQAPYIDSQKVDDMLSTTAQRELMVFFGQKDGGLEHVFSHRDWVGRADHGGMYGDSYGGVEVDNGAVLLHSYGGSRTGWHWTMRVRYQQARWRVIGFSDGSVDRLPPDGQETLDWDETDRNLLTYKVHIKQEKAGQLVRDEWHDIVDKTAIYLSDSRLPALYR